MRWFPYMMAPILEAMEQAIKDYMDIEVELPSCVDVIHAGMCIWDEVEAKTVDMDWLLAVGDAIINRVVAEYNLSLEPSKHEHVVLRRKRRRKNKNVKIIKWMGIIMNETGRPGSKIPEPCWGGIMGLGILSGESALPDRETSAQEW